MRADRELKKADKKEKTPKRAGRNTIEGRNKNTVESRVRDHPKEIKRPLKANREPFACC